MIIRADLHLHGKYSGATSSSMNFEEMSRGGSKKGIGLLGTGDCLHPRWRDEIKGMEKVEDGVYFKNNTYFVLSGEVETKDRVHHLMFCPSIAQAEELYQRLKKFSKNIDSDGRPHVSLSGEELALMAVESGALLGPAHAFTPYTGLYGKYSSMKNCYGAMTSKIYFLELGLSAKSSYADGISELDHLTYLSNSDAHSPYPHRLGREFNEIKLDDISFRSLKMLLEGKKGKILRNVGLPPEEGKYNESACNRCYTHYSLRESLARGWKCNCGGSIKKGVKDRVRELCDVSEKSDGSPPYTTMVPLQEIIAASVGHSSVNTKKVREIWQDLVDREGDEITVLLKTPINVIEELSGEKTAEIIHLAREGGLPISPGGGGKYGKLLFERLQEREDDQRSLMDF
ncbi:MAG: endonuclease Q family protein [Thermoplasmata archaeon]